MIDGQQLFYDDFDQLPTTLDAWHSEHPGMGLLALLPEAGKENVARLQQACQIRGIPLFGAIFPMLITPSGFSSKGLWLLRFNAAPAGFMLETPPSDKEAVEKFTARVEALIAFEEENKSIPPTLFLIFDSMVPNIGSMLTGIYRKLHKRVRYVGVNAGSETFTPMPCLFDAHRIIGDGVMCLIPKSEIRYAVVHDYPVSRMLMRATSATGNRVDRIDGRPAFEVYQEMSHQEFGANLSQENFYDHAVHFPLGVVTAADVLVRIPVAYGDDGAVHCVGEIPPNSMLRVLRAPSIEECNGTDKLMQAINDADGPQAESPHLTFYCAGRRMHFGADAESELEELARHTENVPLAGALSLGEIDTMPEVGIPRFHNAALVRLRRATTDTIPT